MLANEQKELQMNLLDSMDTMDNFAFLSPLGPFGPLGPQNAGQGNNLNANFTAKVPEKMKRTRWYMKRKP